MPDKKRLMNGEHWRQTTVGATVTAIVTLSGMIGYLQISPPRPDPFTGTDATELRRELESKIETEAEKILAELRRLDESHRQTMHDNMLRLRQLESRTWPE